MEELLGRLIISLGMDIRRWTKDRRKILSRIGNVATLEGDAKALNSSSAAGNFM